MIGLVGIKKYSGTLTEDASLRMFGIYQGGESETSNVSIKNQFLTMEKLNYIRYENRIISLTEKGLIFVDYIMSKGIDCIKFNDQIFNKEYKSVYLNK